MSDLRRDLGALVARVRRFTSEDLWSAERYAAAGSVGRFGLLTGRTLYLCTFSFGRERLRLRAAALTYMTLLSLVPALAVVFSLFAAFGGLKDAELRLKMTVIDYLAVGTRGMVESYIDRFVASTHAGAIGGTGVVALVLTAIGLLANMEKSFNDIWGVKVQRSFLERFVRYWPLLTIGPVLMGVSLTLTAAVQSSAVVSRTVHALPMLATGFLLVPLVLTCAGCTLLYAIVPNTRVPLRFALVGGLVAGAGWEMAKFAYAIFAKKAIAYSTIYGSLSAIPLTVIWIFVSWMVVLIGASIAFAAQNAGTFKPQREVRPIPQWERERLAAWLMLRVYQHYEAGKGAIAAEAAVADTAGPPSALRRILAELVERGLLVEAVSPTADGGTSFMPARTAVRTTLADLIKALRDESIHSEDGTRPPGPVEARAAELLDVSEAQEMEVLARTSFAALLEQEPTG